MAIQQIQNLINNQVESPILKVKSQIKVESKKQILKIQEQIPTKEDLKQQFTTVLKNQACNESVKKKIENIYNRIDNLLGKLEKFSSDIRSKMDEIKNKLLKILEDILPKIAVILGILALAITVAKAIIKTIPAAEAANATPSVGSPTLATRLRSTFEKAKKKIQAFGAAIKAFNKKIEKVTKVVKGIIKTTLAALAIILTVGDKISLIRAFLLFLYLKFQSDCEINSPSGGLETGTCSVGNHTTQEACEAAGGIFNNANQVLNGNTNLLEVQAQITALYEGLIEELNIQNKTEIVETITNVVTQYKTRVERKIVPIT
tara:strand:+ start:3154 stop:4107 length:954 start_codon:yes stop_codon:yes gene_type:complete